MRCRGLLIQLIMSRLSAIAITLGPSCSQSPHALKTAFRKTTSPLGLNYDPGRDCVPSFWRCHLYAFSADDFTISYRIFFRPKVNDMLYKGSCFCGTISYEVNGEIGDPMMCHSKMYQKEQGAPLKKHRQFKYSPLSMLLVGYFRTNQFATTSS